MLNVSSDENAYNFGSYGHYQANSFMKTATGLGTIVVPGNASGHRPGVELATSRSQVQRPATIPPSHLSVRRSPSVCPSLTHSVVLSKRHSPFKGQVAPFYVTVFQR